MPVHYPLGVAARFVRRVRRRSAPRPERDDPVRPARIRSMVRLRAMADQPTGQRSRAGSNVCRPFHAETKVAWVTSSASVRERRRAQSDAVDERTVTVVERPQHVVGAVGERRGQPAASGIVGLHRGHRAPPVGQLVHGSYRLHLMRPSRRPFAGGRRFRIQARTLRISRAGSVHPWTCAVPARSVQVNSQFAGALDVRTDHEPSETLARLNLRSVAATACHHDRAGRRSWPPPRRLPRHRRRQRPATGPAWRPRR